MTTTPAPSTPSATVPLLAALDQAWQAIRAQHPDVPAVVLAIGSGTLGERPGVTRLGHYAAGRWATADPGEASTADGTAVSEMFVGGEGLARGARDVLATLLHEAAHGIAHTRGIADTSRRGQYHNARFATLAREVGLDVTQLPRIGWSGTTLPDTTAQTYADELAELAARITVWRRSEHEARLTGPGTGGTGEDGEDDGEQPKDRNPQAALCGCTPPRRIRVAPGVLALGGIFCELCGEEFAIPD